MILWILYILLLREVVLVSGVDTCYFSEGTKHECCTHQHYCIFNTNRVNLEKEIGNLLSRLADLELQLSNLRTGEYYTTANYEDTKKQITIVKTDLRNLRQFENKILKKEIDGYGFV